MQFENLLPESQKAIKEIKKIYERLVLKNASNVLFYQSRPVKIFSKSVVFRKNSSSIEFSSIVKDFYEHYVSGFAINFLENEYFLHHEFEKIKNECLDFLKEKNYFIKIPENKLYAKHSDNSYNYEYFVGTLEQ